MNVTFFSPLTFWLTNNFKLKTIPCHSFHLILILLIYFPFSSPGSVRIPLQMTKCNQGANSTYLSMNSFNNNNLTVPSVNDETNVTTSDNLLLQSTTTAANQHWTRNLNGNSQRSSTASWRATKATLSLNLSDSKAASVSTADDDMTPVNTNNGQKILQSPFDYPTRYRKTWI